MAPVSSSRPIIPPIDPLTSNMPNLTNPTSESFQSLLENLRPISNPPLPTQPNTLNSLNLSYLPVRPFSSFEIDKQPDVKVKKAVFSYFTLWLPASDQKDNNCTICLEPNPTIYFCSTHAFHESCLIRNIYTKSMHLNNKNFYLRTDHFRKEQYSFSSWYSHSTFKVTIPEQNLPNCPTCRGCGGHSYIEAKVEDANKGWLPSYVEIKKDGSGLNFSFLSLPIFDQLVAIYSVFQTVLSQIQQSYPEFANNILNIQNKMLPVDVAITVRNYALLFKAIPQYHEAQYKKNGLKILAGLVFLVAGTFFSVVYFNRYLKTAIDLQELLKKIILPGDLSSIVCQWDFPILQQRAHAIHIARIISELALAYVSPNRLFHLNLAALQTFTLYNVAQLRWINFERTLKNPLETLPFELKDKSDDKELLKKAVKEIKTSFHFLTSSKPVHLQSSLKTVYDYSSNMFKNAVIHRSWKCDLI